MTQVSKKTINVRGELLDLSLPRVMGILNITPDSFYEKSRFASADAVLEQVGIMAEDGAAFVDVGGYSTRPGAKEVSTEEEIDRIESIIEPINKYFQTLSFLSTHFVLRWQKGP